MDKRVCPPWIGYLLVNPLRRIMESPVKILGPHVRPGMKVLEPGPGMGFFTLPMAKMVGPEGLVVAVDIQEKMLQGLRKRAVRAGLADRVDIRLAVGESLAVDDLAGSMDLVVALHVIHEVPDQRVFFQQAANTLKPGGRMLAVEPPGHVSQDEFDESLRLAWAAGLKKETNTGPGEARQAVLVKQTDCGHEITPCPYFQAAC